MDILDILWTTMEDYGYTPEQKAKQGAIEYEFCPGWYLPGVSIILNDFGGGL